MIKQSSITKSITKQAVTLSGHSNSYVITMTSTRQLETLKNSLALKVTSTLTNTKG